MPCDPNDNSLNPGAHTPYPAIPGFGVPTAPIQLPFSDFNFPEGIPEDLEALVNALGLMFPSGLIKPNLDNFSKNILDAVVSLLNQIAPYLGLYKFFLAAFNLILCIIDVLCSLLNPWKLRSAIRRLFKRCLPDFLALFPYIALIPMIIAMLLLLIALIKYLIATITAYVEEIIANLQVLNDGARLNDAEATLAAARKIASLLCLIQNLFSVLIAFAAIMQIIQDLASVQGRSTCRSGGDSECCGDDVCPPWLRNNPDGIHAFTGRLIYFKQLDVDTNTLFPGIFAGALTFNAARAESWQFVNPATGQVYKISDIITEIGGNTFWPEGVSFNINSNIKQVPYFMDLRMFVNPAAFSNTSHDLKGSRFIRINNCIISDRPYIGVTTFNNDYASTPDTGTVHLVGGQVFEDDNITPIFINGQQANLNSFIHKNSGIAPAHGPIAVNDGYIINNIEYTLRYQYESLVSYDLITLGCLPDITVEREVVNAQYADISAVINKIKLPNFGYIPVGGSSSTSSSNSSTGVLNCLQSALTTFRKDVSIDGAAKFQSAIEICLGTLLGETTKAYSDGVTAGFSPYTSSYTLTPDVQFTGSPIKVAVTLKDPNSTAISFNMPADIASVFAARLYADITFGKITSFVYDGYSQFIADITSNINGSGAITVYFDNKVVSSIINRDNNDVSTAIIENVQTYSFIGSLAKDNAQVEVRRDDGDVSRDEVG